MPYIEDQIIAGYDLFSMLMDQDSKYWLVYEDITRSNFQLEEDFKELFMSMIKQDVVERATIEDVKKNKWYNGPIYSQTELQEIMARSYLGRTTKNV